MSARERMRDPWLYAIGAVALALGGAGGRLAEAAVPAGDRYVLREVWEAERASLAGRLGRIEDKLDRLIEREVVR